ncbi:hypothetical protein ASF27_20995 [Methylobacterium sp. Leaf102]|uniref:recombinase family protein n=1 Tax=Methylobacterium sp. Leaf102 TaxID=1736253 RepID=UPI000701CC4F|nr:recombinase family protein [Methylobacterium sp. Leaf102]KQP27460.1 hypothetical protein ASF27_20995 [Methylobacterium sp. Leaf102]
MTAIKITAETIPSQNMSPDAGSTPTYLTPRRDDRPEFLVPDAGKAVIYARFPTTGHNEVSIDRQCELAGEYIEATGRVLVDTYIDRARSGATMVGRDDLERLLLDAHTGAFGVVVVESVDRLARDLVILGTVYERLLALGVEVHRPGHGRISLTDIAAHGPMGDESRRAMGERTRFARDVMAREGRFPTGPCYGYARVVGRPGEPAIDWDQAEVVRRIFAMYASGLSPRMIAIVLDRAGSPTGKLSHWTDRQVRNILANPRYLGVLVYNRYRSGRQPVTGRRHRMLRPREDWIVTEVPGARIVDRDLWERVRRIDDARRADPGRRSKSQARGYLLSGLATCPSCGGRMRIRRSGTAGPRFQCASYAPGGACDERTMSDMTEVERLVVGLVADELADPAFADAYVDGCDEEGKRAEIAHAGVRVDLERRVMSLGRKLEASFDKTLTSCHPDARLAEFRTRIGHDLSEAELALRLTPHHPEPIGIDRARLGSLRQSVASISACAPFQPSDEAEWMLAAAFRELIGKVEVTRVGMELRVDVTLRVGMRVEASGKSATIAAIGTRVLTGMRHIKP